MQFDQILVSEKLTRWEKNLESYQLPRYDALPDLGLYMEQVVTLLKGYLSYLPADEEDPVITPAAINNYVRKKIMPMPVKKKYYRSHIAYLVMICALKQSMSISTLQKMLPADLSEDALKQTYDAFTVRYRASAKYFVRLVRETSAGIFDGKGDRGVTAGSTEGLITSAAVISGFARLLASELLSLADITPPEG
ncbi:MAG: DUF1836 domain-containing protein [Lachnospiraceae bacterium]|nr:DUF1836 domain-containing protein [Lachnospiraceae bacterium]